MKYGLPTAAIEKIRAVFARFPHIERAVLYGSRAKGNFKPGSDIDLTLSGENLTSSQLGEIAEALDDLLLPYTIDLSLYAELNHAKLREHIDRVGVVFYERRGAGEDQGAAGMKKGWKIKTVGEVCDVIGGGTPPKDKPAFYSGKIPWATVRDMRQEVITETEFRITKEAVQSSATNIIPSGNVIIATRVGLGKVCLLGQDTAINQDLRGIIPRDSKTLSIRFLFWWLKAMADVIVAEGTGATVQGVKLPFVKSLQIPVPPLPEQQRIVAILDQAFTAIATAKANAENNLQNARALFESHLQSVFSQRGEGWVEKRLSELCEVFADGDWVESKDQSSEGIRLIQTGNVGEGVFKDRSEKARYISEATFKRLRCTEIFEGDCLISRLPDPVGRSCILPDTGERMITAVDCTIVRFKPKLFLPALFNLYSQSTDYLRTVAKECTGTTRSRISRSSLGRTPIPVPPLPDQPRIVAKLDALAAESRRLESIYQQKLAALKDLKKSLLHNAFNGKI